MSFFGHGVIGLSVSTDVIITDVLSIPLFSADNLFEPMKTLTVDIARRDAKIKELEPETQYRLYIWAFTGEGKGVEQVAEATTTKGGSFETVIYTLL